MNSGDLPGSALATISLVLVNTFSAALLFNKSSASPRPQQDRALRWF